MKFVHITYFVHAATTDNEQGLATGWSPGELSAAGRKQAEESGALVSHKKFDVVFCSDLKRTVDSAALCFGDKYKIIQDKRLRECDYGDFTGKPGREFKSNLAEYVERPFPNGESYQDVAKRMADFLEVLKKEYRGKRVAVVAHQAPQLALDVIIRGKNWQQAIDEDWRKKKAWQPGWGYELKC
jgi:broad specificity phosphatase PhoE